MAPEVVDVGVDVKSVTWQNSFNITVEAYDCDYVYAIVNGWIFQMVTCGTDLWTNRIHACQVGEYTGTFTVYALKTSTGELDSKLGPSITVSSVAPMMPAEFLRDLYLAEGTYNWMNRPKSIITEREAKRFDSINFTCVIIKEGKRIRMNQSRLQYKDVKFNLVVQVYHTDSYEEAQLLFEDCLNVEERFINLPNGLENTGYDYIVPLDEGKVLPSVNIFSVVHNVQLVQVMKKVNIDGF